MTDYTPVWAVKFEGKKYPIAIVELSIGKTVATCPSIEDSPLSLGRAELMASAPRLKEERDELLELAVMVEAVLSNMHFMTASKMKTRREYTEYKRGILVKARELITKVEK